MDDRDLYEMVMGLRDLLAKRGTGKSMPGDDPRYMQLRRELTNTPRVKDKLPSFVKRHRSLDEFWPFIQNENPTYRGRTLYLVEQFAPVLEMLEYPHRQAGDDGVGDSLAVLSSAHVQATWEKALDRRNDDPEGAITAARTLLESVCKHILDDLGIDYGDKDDLPALYTKTAKAMNLGPSQHTEDTFKRILGGAQSVVEGLGSLRNKASDAHGTGRKGVKPLPRHATLAVNLAGSVAQFLVETWAGRASDESSL